MSLIRSSTFAALSVSEETEQEDCDDPDEQLLLRPTKPLSATCSRPPCLKRGSEVVSPWHTVPSSLAVSVGTPSGASVFSFAAPRVFTSVPILKRQVTFDASPPEAFVTFHPEDYDRSQIECTQGGSDFDLRLPTKCKRYDGEGVEEDDEVSEAEEDKALAENLHKLNDSNTTRWACLQRGSVVGCVGGTLAPGVPRPPVDPSSVSLPVHGFKSFGGFGQHASISQADDDSVQSYSNSTDDEGAGSDIEGSDSGAAALEAAALAYKSPNITPRPSPHIVPRWAKCTGYFEDVRPTSPSLSTSTKTSGAQPSSKPSNVTPASTPPLGTGPQSLPSDSVVEDGEIRPPTLSSSASPSSVTVYSSLQTPSNQEVDETVAAASEGGERQSRSFSPPQRPGFSSAELCAANDGENTVNESHPDVLSAADVAAPSDAQDNTVAGSFLATFAIRHSQESSGEGYSSTEYPPCHSSPSPMSSRCSSTDPWGSLSSEDEGSQSPPHGEWCSSTSPDVTSPKGSAVSDAVATPLYSLVQLPSNTESSDFVARQAVPMHQQHTLRPVFYPVLAAEKADISGGNASNAEQIASPLLSGPPKSELRSALTVLEAEMTAVPRGGLMIRTGSHTSGSSCVSSSCTSTDEEGAASSSSRLRLNSAVNPRRKSSLSTSSGLEGEHGRSEGRRDRRSPRSSSSSRKSSASGSRDEQEAEDVGGPPYCPPSQSDDSLHPCSRKRHGSKGASSRSGSGSSSTRSGVSARIRLTQERLESEIEDEGALGGF